MQNSDELDKGTEGATLSPSDRRSMRERGRDFRATKREQGEASPHSEFQAGSLIQPRIQIFLSNNAPEKSDGPLKKVAIPKSSILHKIDQNVNSIYNIYDRMKSADSTKSLRMAIVGLSHVQDGSVDIDDGFEEPINWTNEEQEYINSNTWVSLESKFTETVFYEMRQNGAYICVVDSRKLEFFEILHRGYGIEYPVARKLAQEFANKAALASGQTDSFLAQSPEDVPLMFSDRPDQSQSPLEFLEEHYGRWLQGNGLYQHTLRKHDKALMQHLDRRYVGRREELAKILPNKKAEVDSRLGPAAAHMTPSERKRALDAQRVKISP